MARIHPGHPERLLPHSQQYQEVRTLNHLQSGLPDTIAVYHSVHHGRMEGSRQRFGEIDFVLVNQAGDILLIEQKNGALTETAEGLKKDYGQKTKDVVSQVLTGRTAVMQQLTDVFKGTPPVDVKILLYCPDHRIEHPGTSGLDPAQIVDAPMAPYLERWILDHLREGNPTRGDIARQVRDWASRTLRLEPDLGAAIDLHEDTYQRQAGGLMELVDGLDMHPWCLRIQAAAGAGKSLAATHLFEKARKEGRRPLMLCFNSVLGAALQHALGEHRDVGTFHQWCRRMLELAGGTFDVEAARTDPRYWSRLSTEVGLFEPPEPRYDSFIIDEAQDFDAEWWQILRVFEATDAPIRILCLEDGQQNIYGRSGPDIEDCVHYRSNAVYRTPQRIARFIDRLLKPNLDWRSPFDGFDPEVFTWRSQEEQIDLIAARIDALRERGFAPKQIQLLSMRGRENACFRDLDAIGSHRLRKFTGEFSDDGTPQFTQGDVSAETLWRFKGNQAPAVIVTDFELSDPKDPHAQRLSYCALTRATVSCDLLTRDGSSWLQGSI